MRYPIRDQKGIHFLTFTIVDWIDLFTRPVYAEMMIDSMKYGQAKKGLVVYAYVIMPSHLHLIFQVTAAYTLSEVIQQMKSYTAKQILNYVKDFSKPESRRDWLLHRFTFNARKNRTNSKHQIWQRGNYPIILYSPKVIRQKLSYLHYNPVKAGIVKLPEHYVFSSASNYASGVGEMEVTLLNDLWNDIGYVDLG